MPEMMKVGMYYSNSCVQVEEMDVPEIGPGEVLLKVWASGICGSDIMEWYRITKAPLVLGHEVTGEVEAVGEGVQNYKAGERVWATHHVPCNTCDYCLSGHNTACNTLHTTKFYPGGFSQYIRIPQINVDRGMMHLPDTMSYEEGTFIEPLGTVVRGARKAAIRPGDSVLVLGSGIAGLLYVKYVKILGAGTIIATDTNECRMEAALRFGADFAVNAMEDVPAYVKEKNQGRFADKVIVCAGSLPAAEQALDSVERGGTIMFFAVPKPEENVEIDLNDFWRDDISIMTSYAAAPEDNRIAMELIRTGRVNVKDMITHRLSLEDIAEGFRIASKGEGLKVIIEPNR